MKLISRCLLQSILRNISLQFPDRYELLVGR